MVYNKSLGYYRALPSQLPILADKTYFITVSTPDGRKVNASTSVPSDIAIKEVKIDSTKTTDIQRGTGATNTEYSVKVIWQDRAGEVNVYRGISIFDFLYQLPDPNNAKKTILTPVYSVLYLRTIDDKGTDGQLFSLSRTFQPNNIANPQGKQIRLNKIKIGLFQTDISYYNYHTIIAKTARK